jgi:glutamate:Na+ symporter, ESS family
MAEESIRILTIDEMDVLSLSILVLFFGMYLNRKIHLLEDNYIPPAVTGGVLFSFATWFLYARYEIQVEFDMTTRDLLLLVFFSTVGLSARLRSLAAGGRSLLVLIVCAGVFLFLQNFVGILLAMLNDVHPAYGLFAGSISFAGGHGTAIAWGAVAENAGLVGASGIGMAFATFGLLSGGLVGGPIARRLIESNGLEGSTEELPADVVVETSRGEHPNEWLYPVLATLLLLALCVSLGDLVNRFLSSRNTRLPGFLTAMFVGIVITNTADVIRRPVHRVTLARFGDVSLHVFLAMSMMAIQLWTLGNAASAILLILAAQVLLMTMFAIWIVFRVMGRNYDAVVIAAGFAGLGLGATPVAIANMDAVTARYGPSTKAFLVVPLVGAFFVDLLNAGTINFFIRMIREYLI